MKLPALKVKKISGLLLSGVLLATQSLFAYQPEKNFWAERRRAAQRDSSILLASLPQSVPGPTSLATQFPSPQILRSSLAQSVVRSVPKTFLTGHADLFAALSPAYGSVRKVSLGKNAGARGPVVIHIQDVHMNAEAQKNIRETVATLLKSGKVGLVALEGSTEDIALQPFVDFPNRKAVELTADYLLRENKISGPIHAAMTAQGKLPRILGIDDPAHYAANVHAYKDSAPKLDETRLAIRKRRGELEEQKKAVFSPALLALDQTVTGYRNEKVSLGDYVEAMVKACSVVAPFMGRPFTKSFLQALKTERTLDFKQVEAERSKLIEKLAQTLNPQEINELMAQSLAYRTGELRYGDFYAQLKETCRKKGIRLSDYPAMDEYVRYVLLCDGIDAEQLLNEMAGLEKSAYDALTKTPEEKALATQSRQAWLTSKLVDFGLTPMEWKEYKAGPKFDRLLLIPSSASSEQLLPRGEGNSPAFPSPFGRGKGEGLSLHLELAPFEAFYQEAETRDTAMTKNLLAAMNLQKESDLPSVPVVLLVTGGFHAEGMTQQLTQQGATVISYVPKIEKVDTAQGSAYLSVFTQEKTPLEKLFQGDKLFLAVSPFSRNDRTTLGPALVALLGVVLFGQMAGVDVNVVYATLGGVGSLVGLKIAHDTVRGKLRVSEKGVIIDVEFGREGIRRVTESIQKEVGRWSAVTIFLERQFTKAHRGNVHQLLRELFFLAPALTQILLGWMNDPTLGPLALFLSSLTPLALTLPIFLLYHANVFIDLLKETLNDQSKWRLAVVYFSFVAAGFLLFGLGSSGLFVLILGAMTSGAIASNIPWIGTSLLATLGVAYGIHWTGNQKLPVPAMAKRQTKELDFGKNIPAYAETLFNSSPGNPEDPMVLAMERLHPSFGRKNRIFIELLDVDYRVKEFLVNVLFKSKRTLSVEQTAALLGMWIDPRISDEAVRLVLENLDDAEFGEIALSTLSRSVSMQMSTLRGSLYELWALSKLNKDTGFDQEARFVSGPREIRGESSVLGEWDGLYRAKDGLPIVVEIRDRSSSLENDLSNGGLTETKWKAWVKDREVEVKEKCEKLSKMLSFRPDLFFGEGSVGNVSYVFVMPEIAGLSSDQQDELIRVFDTQQAVSMRDETQIHFTTRLVSLPRVLLMDDKNGGKGIDVKLTGRPFKKDPKSELSSDDIRAIEWKKNEIAQLATRVNAIFAEEKKELIWRFLSAYDIPPGFIQLVKDYVYGRASSDGGSPEQRVCQLIKLDRDRFVRALVRASEGGTALRIELEEEILAATARRNARPLSARYIESQKTGMRNAIARFQDRLRNLKLQDNEFAKKILQELWAGHRALVCSPDDCLTNLNGTFGRMSAAVGGLFSQEEEQSPAVVATVVDLLTDPIGGSYVDLMAQLNLQSEVLEECSYLVRERLQFRAIKRDPSSLPSPNIDLPKDRAEVICRMEAKRFDRAVKELNFRFIFADLRNLQEVNQIMAKLLQINGRFNRDPVKEFENHFNAGGATVMSRHVAAQIAVLSERDSHIARQVMDILFSKTDGGSRPGLDIGLDLWSIQLVDLDFSVSSDLGPTNIERVISEISRLVEMTQDGNNVSLRKLLYLIKNIDKHFKSKIVDIETLTIDEFYDFIQEVNERIILGKGWWASLHFVGDRLSIIPLKIISGSEKTHSYLGEKLFSVEFYAPDATMTNYQFTIGHYSFISPAAFRFIERTCMAHLKKMQDRHVSPFSNEESKLLNKSKLDEDLLTSARSTFIQEVGLRSLMNAVYRKKLLKNVFTSSGDWVNDLIVMRPETYSSSKGLDQRVLFAFLGGSFLQAQLMALIQTMSSVGERDPNLAYGLFLEWIPHYYDVHRLQRTSFDVTAQEGGFTDPDSIATYMHLARWEFDRVKLFAASYLLTDAMGIAVRSSPLPSAGLRPDPHESNMDVGITETNLKNYIDYRAEVTGKKRFLIVLDLLKQVHSRLFYSESERLEIVGEGVDPVMRNLLSQVKTVVFGSSAQGDFNSRFAALPYSPGASGPQLLIEKGRIAKTIKLLSDLTSPSLATEYGKARERAVALSAPIPGGKATGWWGYGGAYIVGLIKGLSLKAYRGSPLDIKINSYALLFAKRHGERAEDVLNAMVSVVVGLVSGKKWDVLSWLSLGTLSPPLGIVWAVVLVIVVWFLLLIGSHAFFRKALERVLGEKPSVAKSSQLFLFYLVPLTVTALFGYGLAAHDLSPFLSFILPIGMFRFIRVAHDRINEEVRKSPLSLLNITQNSATARIQNENRVTKLDVKTVEGVITQVTLASVRSPGWRSTLEFINSQFSRVQRVNPRQIVKELIFLAPAFTEVLITWLADPTLGFASLLLSSLTPLAVTLPVFLFYHVGVFLDLIDRNKSGNKVWVLFLIYFPLVGAGFLVFGLGSTVLLSASLSLLDPAQLAPPNLASLLATTLTAGFGFHRFNNLINPVPAVAKRVHPTDEGITGRIFSGKSLGGDASQSGNESAREMYFHLGDNKKEEFAALQNAVANKVTYDLGTVLNLILGREPTQIEIEKIKSRADQYFVRNIESDGYTLRQSYSLQARLIAPSETRRATSQWGLKLAEWLGSKVGGINGRERFGSLYKRFAAMIEWSFSAKIAFWSFVGTIAFSAAPLGWAVAPAMGAIYGILFVASHFIPESMAPVTKVKVGVLQALTMGVIYGVLISATPFLLGAVPLMGVPEFGFQAGGVLWALAGVLHHSFDKGNPRMEGEQAARELVPEISGVTGAFEAVMPGVHNGHTEQIVGRGSSSPEFMTETLSRLKTDKVFRAGFVGAVQKAMEQGNLSLSQMNLLSVLVKGATGQPIAFLHVLGKSPLDDLANLEALMGRVDPLEEGGFSVALVVPAGRAGDVAAKIAALRAKGVQVFEVTLESEEWNGEILRALERQMSRWLNQANGIVATMGTKVGINPKDIEALDEESKLRAALKNAVTLGEVVQAFLRTIRALASNA